MADPIDTLPEAPAPVEPAPEQPLQPHEEDMVQRIMSTIAAAPDLVKSIPGTGASLKALDWAKTNLVDPALKTAQGVAAVKVDPLLKALPPGGEYTARQLSFPLGELNAPGSLNQMTGDRLAAGKQSASEFGQTVLHAAGNVGSMGGELEPLGTQNPEFQPSLEAGHTAVSAGAGLLQTLPLFMIPGVEGYGAAIEFGTQGAAFEMARPGGKPSAGLLGGAVVGGVGQLVKAGVGAAKAARAAKAAAQPIAFAPREGVNDLAKALLAEPAAPAASEATPVVERVAEAAADNGATPVAAPRSLERRAELPREPVMAAERPMPTVPKFENLGPGNSRITGTGKPATSSHVLDVEEGRPVVYAVTLDAKGVPSKQKLGDVLTMTRGELQTLASEAHVMPTEEALNHPELTDENWSDLLGRKNRIESIATVRKLGANPAERVNLEPAAGAQAAREELEHGVVVLQDGEGAFSIERINSPDFKRRSLTTRGLVEVRLSPGTQPVYGFHNGHFIQAPEAAEGIPNALTNDIPLDAGRWRRIEDPEQLDEIIAKAQVAKAESEMRAAVPQGTPAQPLPPVQPVEAPPPVIAVTPAEAKRAEVSATYAQRLPPSLIQQLTSPKNIGKRVAGILVHDSLNAEKEATQLALTQLALNNPAMQAATGELAFKSLMSKELLKLPAAKQHEFAVAVNDAIESVGTKKAAQVDLEWAPIAQWKKAKVEDAIQGLIDRDQMIRDLGGMPDMSPDDLLRMLNSADPAAKQAVMDFMTNYATQPYLRFVLPPGKYAQIVQKDAQRMERFRKMVDDILTAKRPERVGDANRAAETEGVLLDMLGYYDGTKRSTGTQAGEWVRSFIERKDLSKEVKEILGASNHGPYRIALATVRQQAAIANLSMWETVADGLNVRATSLGEPVFLRTQSLTADGAPYRQLANVPHLYGKAAGGFLHPDYYTALVDAPRESSKAAEGLLKYVQAATKWTKMGQTIYGVNNLMNQAMGNVAGILTSGSTFTPWGQGRLIRQAMRDFGAFSEEATSLGAGNGSAAAKRYLAARNLGVPSGSLGSVEIGGMSKFLEKRLLEDAGLDYGGLLSKVGEKVMAAHNKWAHVISIPDEIAKYGSWLGLLEKAGVDLETHTIVDSAKALKFLGDQAPQIQNAPRLTDLVEREAARRVWLSFPYMNRTQRAIATAQKSGLGVINPYIGIQTEQLRTYAHLPGRLATEPGYRAHMLKVTAVLGGLWAAKRAISEANGIDTKTVDQNWANQPEMTKWLYPAATAVPFRDSEGRVQMMDMSGLIEPMRFLQGDPDSPTYKRILMNLAAVPLQGGAVDNEWTSVLNAMFGETLPNIPSFTPAKPYENQMGKLLDQGLRAGMGGPLQAPTKIMNVAHQTGQLMSPGQQIQRPHLTPGQAGAKLLGGRPIPASSPTIHGMERLRQVKGALGGLKSALNPLKEGQWQGPIEGKRSIAEDAKRAADLLQKQGSKK